MQESLNLITDYFDFRWSVIRVNVYVKQTLTAVTSNREQNIVNTNKDYSTKTFL